MENINNIEQNPSNIEVAPSMEIVSPMGEVGIPQNLPPVENKPFEEKRPQITEVKNSNKLNQSLGYSVTEDNKSLGSEIVREKMIGDIHNL
jgi:hypothetical protein